MVEIALSSSDRRMKVTACELLQAVCLLMLGNDAKGPMRRRGDESQSVSLLSILVTICMVNRDLTIRSHNHGYFILSLCTSNRIGRLVQWNHVIW